MATTQDSSAKSRTRPAVPASLDEAIQQGWQHEGRQGKELQRVTSNESVEAGVAEFSLPEDSPCGGFHLEIPYRAVYTWGKPRLKEL